MTDFSIMVSPKLIRIQSNVKIGYIIGLYKLCSIYPQVRLEGILKGGRTDSAGMRQVSMSIICFVDSLLFSIIIKLSSSDIVFECYLIKKCTTYNNINTVVNLFL